MMVNPAHKEWELVKDEKLNIPVVLVYSDWLEEHGCLEEAEAWRWMVKQRRFPAESHQFEGECYWNGEEEARIKLHHLLPAVHNKLQKHIHVWYPSNTEPDSLNADTSLKYYPTPLDALLDLVQARMVTK